MMWQWIPGGGECASLTRCSNPALLQLDVAAITRFVEDWGLDGVDIDFEAEAGCSKGTDGKVKCHSDADYISAIQLLRAALPRPYILTTAAWSIGAYGEG
jgi:chitinase